MSMTPDITKKNGTHPPRRRRPMRRQAPAARSSSMLASWLQGQAINVTRHAEALRPFRRDEFGDGAAAPTEAHIQASNELIGSLRGDLLNMTRRVSDAVEVAVAEQTTERIQRVLRLKERAHGWVQAI